MKLQANIIFWNINFRESKILFSIVRYIRGFVWKAAWREGKKIYIKLTTFRTPGVNWSGSRHAIFPMAITDMWWTRQRCSALPVWLPWMLFLDFVIFFSASGVVHFNVGGHFHSVLLNCLYSTLPGSRWFTLQKFSENVQRVLYIYRSICHRQTVSRSIFILHSNLLSSLFISSLN